MEVLVDRCALLVDELQEMLQEMGAVPLDESVASVVKGIPACRSRTEKECQEQMAIKKEIRRYRAEVEEPAFAMMRERKACRAAGAAAGARKEPVTFTCADADYYSKVLDGIDVRLPPLAAAPDVNSLTIAISWPPTHRLRRHPIGGYIASCHDYYLALSLGPSSSFGCYYLVFNSWANSVALVPPLPVGWVTNRSHCNIGVGVAILRHSIDDGCYLLAELHPRQDARSHLGSNKATLFVWFSPGSGPVAGQWIQKEVVLPLPADDDDEEEGRYSFRASMVLQVSRTSLCWVDLQTGILVCNHLDRLANGTTGDDDLVFHFIPLPEECAMKPDPLSRWQTEKCRSMTCMDSENITFVCMDGYKKGHPHSEVVLTTWSLKFPLENHWSWEKRRVFSARDLFDGLPFFIKDDSSRLQRLMPSCPVISSVQPDVAYLSVADSQYNFEHERWEAEGFYELRIDMTLPRVVASRLHSSRPLILLRRG